MHHASPNWFTQGGQAYARFRPEYPPQLAAYLAEQAPDSRLAIDVGCGNGQLSQQLATHFQRVLGVDPSAEQIQHAVVQPGLSYLTAPAEQLPLAEHSASLISAAQAAHWFDLPRFYAEVRRVAAPQALLALISYGVLQLGGELEARFQRFYWDEIGPYWPPERKLVDSGYASLDFPFAELSPPALSIELSWDLEQFLGYLSTWSAVRSAAQAGRADLLERFADDISELWGQPSTRRAISWPIRMRSGRVD
ncbi:class I SAM-dependent methyltransferase [Pseudomonas sp. 5P_3.1_Bac2]|uniref:class I SAM-dependent methyltransferase n=1 Tax=Pseudomonas sp. 5P_3.1_Bac2 TaxID=2971617 RepID=UPI0021C60CD3|nr:class I SAM-dependent methyltransferase [Pseudomonas sp. 5P_3.1_Bac2]MCU1715536.1 class I SAM-dependent methyltransferase [Pseudomonas sp. 5P_3.1_Bac2]